MDQTTFDQLMVAALNVEIISITARLHMAEQYVLNDKMQLEAQLLRAQLIALKHELGHRDR